MKKINKIPITKIQRATKLIQTGAKVGVNYLKYYGDKIIRSETEAKDRLDESNATDIYDSLKELKGSPLKVAQMLSMDKNVLPQAYVEKFSLSQFSVPPLSPALVMNVFKKSFGKFPQELYDSFNATSSYAASIGQVHEAIIDDKKLAVKIQYPGVSESIASDLALVKPIAKNMFNMKGISSEKYFKEVENKLIEETDYELEIKQSIEISELCSQLKNLKFPSYYKSLSNKQIITMDWMDGIHLSEFSNSNISQVNANKIGQTLWDFYMYQIHFLKKVHADPHPGNFLVSKNDELIALDFGCMKFIPDEFYTPYFELSDSNTIHNSEEFTKKLFELELIKKEDTEKEAAFFKEMFHEMLSLFTEPFQNELFDFSDSVFFQKITDIGDRYSNNKELRSMNGSRGSKHFIYMNRTFFGLYNLMFELKAKDIKVNNYLSYSNSEQ